MLPVALCDYCLVYDLILYWIRSSFRERIMLDQFLDVCRAKHGIGSSLVLNGFVLIIIIVKIVSTNYYMLMICLALCYVTLNMLSQVILMSVL